MEVQFFNFSIFQFQFRRQVCDNRYIIFLKKTEFLFVCKKKAVILPAENYMQVSCAATVAMESKGNQVKILDRPAAVSPVFISAKKSHCQAIGGKVAERGDESEDLPACEINVNCPRGTGRGKIGKEESRDIEK